MMTQTSNTSTQLDLDAYSDTATAERASAIGQLTNCYAEITGRVRVLHEDVEAGRRNVRQWNLDDRTGAKARLDGLALLDELAVSRGFGWSEIARLVGVSVSAVRKWRAGESPSASRRRDLARLAAFIDLLDEIGPIGEPAGWLMMRLSDAHTATLADLYVAGRVDDLLEHAEGHLSARDLLDRWSPSWRDDTTRDWQVVDSPDGGRSIVRRA